jgi:hypothetical protein
MTPRSVALALSRSQSAALMASEQVQAALMTHLH